MDTFSGEGTWLKPATKLGRWIWVTNSKQGEPMPQPHVQTLNSKIDPWELPCSGISCSCLLLEKGLFSVLCCPTYSHYPSQAKNHCPTYFILFILFYFGLSSIIFPSRRESGRAEFKCLILGQDQGSQFGAGVGAIEMAEQRPHHKEGFCEANWGGWGKLDFWFTPDH